MDTSIKHLIHVGDTIAGRILEVSLHRWMEMLDINHYRYEQAEINVPNIREVPELIGILIKDATTNRNIRWATDSYLENGNAYQPDKPIRLNHVTNGNKSVVVPRVTKAQEEQKNRTRVSAEVFTPTWVVKKQNDLIEEEFKDLELDDYVNKTWLEITCGEGPYMCSRYDTVSGDPIEIKDRVGFVDRKLQRISKEISDYNEWMEYVIKAYKASYGYDFQGDSLLLARENMLYTFVDYHVEQFGRLPELEDMVAIAEIIRYNVFQMDGLKYVIPFTEDIDAEIMDWDDGEMMKFKQLLEESSDE